MISFSAWWATEQAGGQAVSLSQHTLDDLPPGEVLVKVAYSSINYKDAMAITGRGKILRQLPMIPGVDLAGEVVSSTDSRFVPGMSVMSTGWGVGERYSGGFAGYARLKADWLQPVLDGVSPRQVMAIGTAGFTAMLCIHTLQQQGVLPGQGEVLVTGATGGVGSVALMLLAVLGYQTVAVTGKLADHDAWLQALGASRVMDRNLFTQPARPLESETWAAAIDTAGGAVLAGLLPRIRYGGVVVACGLAAGHALNTTVMPFILRGITLAGVDSVMCPMAVRQAVWQRYLPLIPWDKLASVTHEVGLADIEAIGQRMLAGQTSGRYLVRIDGSLDNE